MVVATSNKSKGLLCLSYIGHVQPQELEKSQADLRDLLADLPAGYVLLVDLSGLAAMDLECVTPLGGLMEMIDRSGVGSIVRVIPDPLKDIGLNILTIFHYPHRPKIITCTTMAEAARHLPI